ncbi:Ribosomal small subunit pseudouridine synthase A [compost metagenome]
MEGKFHQVKRMFEAVGKKVIHLKRVSMGPLLLDETLAEGSYRELLESEVELLKAHRQNATS